MKYEFHIGDYVETKADSIGYISHIDGDDIWWYCVYEKDGFRAGTEYCVTGIENDELVHYYNRIGQYNFTKPEPPKEIGKLTPNGWYMGTTGGDDLIRKINELVDAVNELRKDYDKHLEAHRQTER